MWKASWLNPGAIFAEATRISTIVETDYQSCPHVSSWLNVRSQHHFGPRAALPRLDVLQVRATRGPTKLHGSNRCAPQLWRSASATFVAYSGVRSQKPSCSSGNCGRVTTVCSSSHSGQTNRNNVSTATRLPQPLPTLTCGHIIPSRLSCTPRTSWRLALLT